jgi:predicted protein tyrosine phosphatase
MKKSTLVSVFWISTKHHSSALLRQWHDFIKKKERIKCLCEPENHFMYQT